MRWSSRPPDCDDAGVAEGADAEGGVSVKGFPDGSALASPRLDLEPLRVEHAEEMAPLLDDPGLHAFIGGEPASLPELRERYQRLAVGGSRDGSERWLNWVVRRREDGRAVGTVQSTVTVEGAVQGAVLVAELAWVVATPHQGHGYGREAAGTVVTWLRERGVGTLLAHVHPDHQASQGVARAVGFTATTTMVGEETRWQG